MSEMPFIDPPSQFTADTLPVRETTIDQIDLERVATHIAEAKQRERYEGSDDPMEYLHSRRCVVRVGTSDYLTVTGILSFSRAPQAIFPHAVVDIEHYTHNDVIATDLVYAEPGVGGSIFNQIDYLDTYLWENTHHGTTLIANNLQQAEVHEYPRAAIRQLAVHMLAQRDYAIYAIASRAQLFGNRIEWTAPGGLPAGQNIEQLLSAYQPRNPNIAQVLYEAGYLTTPQQGPEATTAI
ncbi:MAG: hypothetical protein HGA19_15425, partial [Oscillochloris sp.]|nr:hypothetical protein [Oscillochloris sp.]